MRSDESRAPAAPEGEDEAQHYGHDLDIVRRGLKRQSRTPEQIEFALAAVDRLAARLRALSSEIATVREERDRLNDEMWNAKRDAAEQFHALAALRDENEALRADAERWRWFRQFLSVEQDAGEGGQYLFIHDDRISLVFREGFAHTVDSLTDAARSSLDSSGESSR